MNDQISPHPFPTDGATTAGESQDLPFGMSSLELHGANVARYIADLQRQLAEREQEIAECRRDVEEAAGELLIPIPEPGTDLSRVCIASRVNLRRAQKAENENGELRAALAEAQRDGERLEEFRRSIDDLASMKGLETEWFAADVCRLLSRYRLGYAFAPVLEETRKHLAARSPSQPEPQ